MKNKLLIISIVVAALLMILPVSAVYYDYSYAGFPSQWVPSNSIVTISPSFLDIPSATASCNAMMSTSGAIVDGYGLSACTVGQTQEGVWNIQNATGCGEIVTQNTFNSVTLNTSQKEIYWFHLTCKKVGYSPDTYMQYQMNITQRIPASIIGNANFTGTPVYGPIPLTVNFSDTSNQSMYNTQRIWSWGDGTSTTTSNKNITHIYNNPGSFWVNINAYSAAHGWNSNTKPNYINATAPPAANLTLNVDFRDINTNNYLQSPTVGIKNTTSGLWRNTTFPTGAVSLSSTGTNGEFPLIVGQVVTIAGSAYGYQPLFQNVTLPYNNYNLLLYLTPLNQTPTNGNWNLKVRVIANRDAQPIGSATVTLTTGVTGPGTYQQYTDFATGTASFLNVSASSTALVNVVKQGYQAGTAYTPVVPNSTQQITIQLVKIGETPVTTPIPVTTTTQYGTAVPTVTITDANGVPITSGEGKALWGLEQLFNIIPQIAMIVASLIIAWLFWRGLDIVTNGMASLIIRKVIEGFLKGMFK
jgi:PKD repeat protein